MGSVPLGNGPLTWHSSRLTNCFLTNQTRINDAYGVETGTADYIGQENVAEKDSKSFFFAAAWLYRFFYACQYAAESFFKVLC